MMIELPSLRRVSSLYLSREGGVAYLPGRRQRCTIDLADCPPDEREAICQVVKDAAPQAVATEQAGRGDQRYFLIELSFTDDEPEPLSFSVPEQDAPEELLRLWDSRSS
jgi:hypothetical protein